MIRRLKQFLLIIRKKGKHLFYTELYFHDAISPRADFIRCCSRTHANTSHYARALGTQRHPQRSLLFSRMREGIKYNICMMVFYISKVVGKVTVFAASDYGTTNAHINKSYFNSIHLHRSKTGSPMKIILRVGEILCRISPY